MNGRPHAGILWRYAAIYFEISSKQGGLIHTRQIHNEANGQTSQVKMYVWGTCG